MTAAGRRGGFWKRGAGTHALLLAGLLALAALLPSRAAQALELYSLLDSQCRAEPGLIVHISEAEIFLLNLRGGVSKVARPSVKHVLVYNVLDNPIAEIAGDGQARELLRVFVLGGEQRPEFTGWPIRFFEELIVFFDIEGNTHIYDIDKIQNIHTPAELPARIRTTNFKPLQFGFGNFLPECPRQPAGTGETAQPTRIITDQIKIGKFFSDYQVGFENLNRFQSRTVYYARPFLYPKPFQFSLFVNDTGRYAPKELGLAFPFNFQWASGKPFGRQAFFSLGTRPVELLPNVEPVFSIRSDVKAHLFSATFVGNALGTAQGGSFVVDNRFFLGGFFSLLGPDDLLVFPHFNQLALTGLDWGGHSFSAGFYYPVFGVYGNQVFREVLSPHSSVLAGYRYTTEKLGVRLTHSGIQLGSEEPTTDDIRVIPAEELRSPQAFAPGAMALQDALERFSLRASFYRAGVDWELTEVVRLSLDQVILNGVYEERIAGEDYRLAFQQRITSLQVLRRFGQRVNLRMIANYFRRAYQSQSGETAESPTVPAYSLSLEVGFVF